MEGAYWEHIPWEIRKRIYEYKDWAEWHERMKFVHAQVFLWRIGSVSDMPKIYDEVKRWQWAITQINSLGKRGPLQNALAYQGQRFLCVLVEGDKIHAFVQEPARRPHLAMGNLQVHRQSFMHPAGQMSFYETSPHFLLL